MKITLKPICLERGLLAGILYIIYPDIQSAFGLGYFEPEEYREMVIEL